MTEEELEDGIGDRIEVLIGNLRSMGWGEDEIKKLVDPLRCLEAMTEEGEDDDVAV